MIPRGVRGVIPHMGRWLWAPFLLAVAGCSEGGSVGDPCGGDSFWVPGGAGEIDAQDGPTRTYANGHPLDWLETDPSVIADEIALIGLINNHRLSLGLPALQFDRGLTQCARGHSAHHFADALFEGHVNPEGHSFINRMEANGIDFESTGENLSYHTILPQTVFNDWLASPTDRENMERMCFIRIGVGKHQDVWTANFAR